MDNWPEPGNLDDSWLKDWCIVVISDLHLIVIDEVIGPFPTKEDAEEYLTRNPLGGVASVIAKMKKIK